MALSHPAPLRGVFFCDGGRDVHWTAIRSRVPTVILPRYRIASSTISGAGQGVFLDEPVAAGRVVIAPDSIPRVYRWEEVMSQPDPEAAQAATVRWFEDRFTITPDWPDDCYVNHSFAPNGIWHLGFIFAGRDLAPGEELTVDYRHLLGEGQVETFTDAATGEPIIGFGWQESLRQSTGALRRLLG